MQAKEDSRGGCLTDELFASYFAGELSGEERAAIERHLEMCSECSEEMAGFDEVLLALKQDDSETTCDVADAVMSRISSEAAQDPPVIPFGWSLLRAAALLFVALMLGIMVSSVLDRGGEPVRLAGTAVNNAAEWLLSVQAEDGSWDPKDWGGRKELGASLTGLAMLALMQSDIEADEELARAEDYLVSIQNKDGSFGPDCVGSMYNHGIASKALIELKRQGIGKAGSELDSALAYILAKQSPAGGWSYREADSRNSSIGVSVWQLQALMAGREAGMGGLDEGLRDGLVWLNGEYSGAGGFDYGMRIANGDVSSTVKAMGAMCMLSAGKEVLGMLNADTINDALTVAMSEGNGRDPYKSYFIASAADASGRESLEGGLADLRQSIAKNMVTKGDNAGSWDSDVKWGSVGGRVYSTAMAALALSNGYMGDVR